MEQFCTSIATIESLVELIQFEDISSYHPQSCAFTWWVLPVGSKRSKDSWKPMKPKPVENNKQQTKDDKTTGLQLYWPEQLCLYIGDIYGSQTLALQCSSITSCWLTAQLFTQQHHSWLLCSSSALRFVFGFFIAFNFGFQVPHLNVVASLKKSSHDIQKGWNANSVILLEHTVLNGDLWHHVKLFKLFKPRIPFNES